MITEMLDTVIDSDIHWTAEQARDPVAYVRHTYDKYHGEQLSEEDIRLFSAGGNPERLTEEQKEFILNRCAELQLANRRAVFRLFQFVEFRELGLVDDLNEYMQIFPREAPIPLLLTAYERAKEKAG